MYSFRMYEKGLRQHDLKVISNLSSAGFKDDTFTVLQGDDVTNSSSKKQRFKGRSAVVESVVNREIDNAMSLMG